MNMMTDGVGSNSRVLYGSRLPTVAHSRIICSIADYHQNTARKYCLSLDKNIMWHQVLRVCGLAVHQTSCVFTGICPGAFSVDATSTLTKERLPNGDLETCYLAEDYRKLRWILSNLISVVLARPNCFNQEFWSTGVAAWIALQVWFNLKIEWESPFESVQESLQWGSLHDGVRHWYT